MPLLTLSHKRKGKHRSCQDAFAMKQLPVGTALAVADGHGGKYYVRSGLGARFACAAAVKLLEAGVTEADFPGAVKDEFDRMVDKHLQHRPLADWELERLDGLPFRNAYGTTLLAAYITERNTTVFQLGDGAIHALGTDGTFLPPLEEDANCQGNCTTSLVQPREFVLPRFRSATYEDCAVLMLFTDGYRCTGRPLDLVQAMEEPEAMTAALQKGYHGDDQTLLLAAWSDAIASEDFSVGFEKETRQVRQQEAAEVQRCLAEAEYRQLYCYLSLAAKTRDRMVAQQDPRLENFNARLEKKLRRFEELCDFLSKTKEENECP